MNLSCSRPIGSLRSTLFNPKQIYLAQPLIANNQIIRNRRCLIRASAEAAANDSPAKSEKPSRSRWNPQLRTALDDTYIRSLVGKQWRHLVVGFAAMVLCVAGNLASPVLSGALFETLVQGKPFETYKQLLLCMAGIYIFEPLLTQVYIRQVCKAAEEVQSSLRRETFRVLLMQRMDFFDRHRASELTGLLSQDLDAIRSFVFSNVSRDRGLRAISEAGGSVIVLSALAWRLGPILAGVIFATACTAWLYKNQTKSIEQKNARAQARMAQTADETFANIRTVRMFAGESLERERFGTYVKDSYESGIGFSKAKAILECLNRGAIHLSLVALYALGGYLVNNGLMPVRTLLSAIGFTFSLVFATQGTLQSFTDARKTQAAVRRVQGILSEVPIDPSMAATLPPGAWWEVANERAGRCELPSTSSIDEDYDANGAATAVQLAFTGDLNFSNVSFAYPARPSVMVLKNLDLKLEQGKVTALVGRSGAGKSTVAALAARLYAPCGGDIQLAGRSIETFPRSDWVQAVTTVSQEPVLFSGTIGENIAYGKPHASQAEIEAAAEAAYAHKFIMDLPEGYNTLVGERGGLLSGGQRQRIALARALLKNSPILILDEATSALDAESERLVQAAIDKLVLGRTTLVIAHRLSTVQNAHSIVVVDDGNVLQKGTHEELTAEKTGLYAQLVSSQSLTLSSSM